MMDLQSSIIVVMVHPQAGLLQDSITHLLIILQTEIGFRLLFLLPV